MRKPPCVARGLPKHGMGGSVKLWGGNPSPCTGEHTCPLCIRNRSKGSTYPNHRGYVAPAQVRVYSNKETIMQRPTETQAKAMSDGKFPDELWQGEYPLICQYLTTTRWEDGSDREPSALAISLREEGIQLALNDKALRQSAYTTAGSVEEAMGLMEGALTNGRDIWRAWNNGKKRK